MGSPAVPPAPVDLPERDLPLWRAAAAVLDGNWTGTHTVPSRTLYPHQWSWDTAFICVGLAHLAPDRAWRDLASLFATQWPDGRVPHIVFDPAVTERDYFPGPGFWRGPTVPEARRHPIEADQPPVPSRVTSGLVQPPVHALGAWEIYRRAADRAAVDRLRWFYPRLVAQQDYLAGNRDIGGAGLVSIVHPWESGLDNSPCWDPALADVPVLTGLLRRYRRRDNQVAASQHRPTDDDYARYLALALAYRDGGYQDGELLGRHPFLVECPGFNALRGAAELALARIAEVIGADPAPHRAAAALITRTLSARLFDPGSGMFHALDVRTGRLAPARCVNGLLPLILPGLPADRVAALVGAVGSPWFCGPDGSPVSSYDRTATDFEALRYWRGPVWVNMNWLLVRALREHGQLALAAAVRAAVLDLVRRYGCHEYFAADTGHGIGSPAFSWTAALTLDLLAMPDVRE